MNLDQLVNEVWLELEPDRQGRNIIWKAASLPPVKGDRAMVKLVWANLIANAIKYTRQNQAASITVGVVPREGELEFFVSDNGVGFDMRYVHRLFGVFQRLHHPEQFEGTGIGLANVRRIINRHGGRVWATAEIDRGATFCFTLPTGSASPA